MAKIIGYFKSTEEPQWPMPVPMKNNKKYISGFEEKCKKWLEEYEKSKPVVNEDGSVIINSSHIEDNRWVEYMGCSHCRICNKSNGSLEYNYCGFRFPIGIFHYILDHNIEIPLDFQEMIVNQPLLLYKNLHRVSMYENLMRMRMM
mgnify:FL=1